MQREFEHDASYLGPVELDALYTPAYQQAREDQSRVEGRIAELEAVLRNHVIIEEVGGDGSARLGSRVVIADEYGEAEYQIVGPQEADPRAGRISTQSPVGRALLGARAGERVSVVTPEGTRSVEVRAVR